MATAIIREVELIHIIIIIIIISSSSSSSSSLYS